MESVSAPVLGITAWLSLEAVPFGVLGVNIMDSVFTVCLTLKNLITIMFKINFKYLIL